MSRKRSLVTIGIVALVSITFGVLLGGGPLRRADAEPAGVVSSALAAPASGSPPMVALPSFADIAERANPAVVSIKNIMIKKVSNNDRANPLEDPFQFFFGPGPQDRQRQGGGDDEEEQRQEGAGSGFIISEDGHILTNNHVAENAWKLEVTLMDGQKYEAKVVGKDELIDLALIKIDPKGKLPTLPMGDSDALRVGEWVVAIGNPLGFEHTVTAGVVSGKGRQLLGGDLDSALASFIQTDAAINFGNSGGPLLNARGEVVGINTAITRNSSPFNAGLIQGIGFALPINLARNAVAQLKETGRVARGYLGISIKPVTETVRKGFGLPSASGALVDEVTPGLPADEAGLKDGDVIVSVDGAPVKDTAELIRTVSSRRPGETVSLGVIRDGKDMKIKVRLGDREKELTASTEPGGEEKQGGGEGGAEATADRFGFRVAEITPLIARQLDLPRSAEGVVVEDVKPSSSAWEEGLRKGHVITKVNGAPIGGVRAFREAISGIKPGDVVRLYTLRHLTSGDWRGGYVIFQAEK